MKAISTVKIISAALLACMLCSCTKTEHLSDISIVEGMSINRSDSGFEVTVQTLNLAKSGNPAEGISGNVTMNVSGTGDNISRAIDNASEGVSKKLFFGQNRIIILGSSITGSSAEACLDYFIRSNNSQPDVALCIFDGNPISVLENEEHDALVPAQALSKMLKNGQESGFAAYVTACEAANLYLDETSDFYLPVIDVDGDNTYSSKTAVYNGARLAAVLDKQQTLGFLLMKNKVDGGLLTVNDGTLGAVSFEIVSSRAKTKARLENGIPVFSADIKLTLIINEIENGARAEITNSDVARLEREAQEATEKYCRSAFETCTQHGSDALRIGKHIARHSNAQYSEIKSDWKALLPTSQLDITVKCTCRKINDNAKV